MKILKGTVFGGIAYFLLGGLVYGILFMDFFAANMNQCTNRPEGIMIWWAMVISNLAAAFLLTLILNWSGAKGIVDGLKIGTIFGVLIALIYDLSLWSMSTVYSNFGSLMVDLVISTLIFSIVGVIIVLFWGKEKNK